MDKFELIAKDVIRGINQRITDKKANEQFQNLIIDCVKRYFPQPSPVLEAGMWATTSTLTDFGILMITKESRFEGKIKYDCLDIKGNACWGFAKDLIKKDFTESDLALLNTDEVKCFLEKKSEGYYVAIKKTNIKNPFGESTTAFHPSIHDAIAEAFTQVLAMNLLRKQIGEK